VDSGTPMAGALVTGTVVTGAVTAGAAVAAIGALVAAPEGDVGRHALTLTSPPRLTPRSKMFRRREIGRPTGALVRRSPI
jgi:hypothetical protein